MRQRGFTLVEMLVALSVAALLVTLVYGGIRVVHRTVNATDALIENNEIMRISWQFLHSALSRARLARILGNREDLTGFSGDGESLSFVADMPPYLGLGGPTRITLATDRLDGAERLLVTRQRFDFRQETADEPPQQAVLLDQLDSLRITYFGQLSDETTPGWHDAWSERSHLPNLVSIRVKPAGSPAWPELIARPLAGTQPVSEEAPPEDRPDAAEPPE
ncbi:MAG: prepilin-type N-terminal cleavage/methylation domain-containing protein [Gammaproteobacteria bacterium]|nr:prepilin-type N-terminal cleavage/methylation domain-containing protein [Gammaproteobacteria bacterium]